MARRDHHPSPLALLEMLLRSGQQGRAAAYLLPFYMRGLEYARRWVPDESASPAGSGEAPAHPVANPLHRWLEARNEGPGVYKWMHYLDVYHRHFAGFIGREVHVLEVGVYSGGSLQMWRDYFGPRCRAYGVDIRPECKAYEDETTTILIGDQGDPGFWKRVKRSLPRIDIVVDDGGHLPEQQITTLEEILPHLRPGGVYFCEDITGEHNGFAAYAFGLASHLNLAQFTKEEDEEGLAAQPTAFQKDIRSIHFYPFATVIERASKQVQELVAPKMGSQWQDFL